MLHGFDLTYALIWPDPPRRRRQAYALTCTWLRACFAEIGQPIRPGADALTPQPGNCFSSATEADLVHHDGAKRIGSAQFWRHGALLQHGSIQIDPCADLWREVFSEEPPALPPLPLAWGALSDLLLRQAMTRLPMAVGRGLCRRDLNSEDLAAIAQRLNRYDLLSGGGAETSPAVTIDRAT